MTAVFNVPASVATLGARIEQPVKAHAAFLRWLVGRILVQYPTRPARPVPTALQFNMCYAKLRSTVLNSHNLLN